MKTAPTTSLALLALLGLAGCGGAGGGAAAAPARSPSAAPQAQGAQRRLPGVSGLIAAIQGTTLQVQDTSSQTAVVYTAATKITQTVAARRSELAVGQCVSVRSVAADPAASPETAGAGVTAASVTISSPVNGSCTVGFGGGFGGGPGRVRPSGAPAFVRPSGAPRAGGFRGGRGTFGTVAAITGTSFTVAAARFGRPGTAAPLVPAPVVVTTTAGTTFDKQVRVTAAALKTGLCVTARGPQDSSGTVTATSLALRPAIGGSCISGIGARNG